MKETIRSFFLLSFIGLIVFIMGWYFIDEIMNEIWGRIFGLVTAFIMGYIIAQTIAEDRQVEKLIKKGYKYDVMRNEWTKNK